MSEIDRQCPRRAWRSARDAFQNVQISRNWNFSYFHFIEFLEGGAGQIIIQYNLITRLPEVSSQNPPGIMYSDGSRY